LLRGRTINVRALDFDKWERKLARVSVEDSDIGEALLKDGLARKWTKKWDHKPEPWCQS
jgi:endonuclease YncB( thermonuclease family)